MTEKEEKLLNEMTNYFRINKVMPTERYLQKIFNYKSHNSISQYIKSLEKKGYLVRHNKKIILNDIAFFINENLIKINLINEKNKFIYTMGDKRKKYYAFKIKNNYFKNINIIKNDVLIIQKKKIITPNKLGLFYIDNDYRIMKYDYKNGFYILSDNETLYLNKINLIGEVIKIERKI